MVSAQEDQNQEAQIRQMLLLKKRLLRQGVSAEARERLGSVRSANPELAERAENVCLQLIQQGRFVKDDVLKQILERLSQRHEIKITRR